MYKKVLNHDIALLISRLIVGSIFVYSGWMKVTDMTTTLGFFNDLHIPAFITYIVSYGELVGGILLILGLWNCLATVFLSVIMIVAIYMTRSGGMQMFGLPLAVLASLIAIHGAGSGKYSLKK